MKVYFDDSGLMNDLDKVTASLDRWDKPIVVVPTVRNVRDAQERYSDDEKRKHITFITYDYFLSKKWIADDDYNHIDFFRVDKFLIERSYGVRAGIATVKRSVNSKIETTDEEVKGEE